MSNSRISNLYFPCVCITIRQITLYLPALTEFIAWARIICLYNMFFSFHLQYILCESGYVYIVSVNFLCRVSRTIGLLCYSTVWLVDIYLNTYIKTTTIRTQRKTHNKTEAKVDFLVLYVLKQVILAHFAVAVTLDLRYTQNTETVII